MFTSGRAAASRAPAGMRAPFKRGAAPPLGGGLMGVAEAGGGGGGWAPGMRSECAANGTPGDRL